MKMARYWINASSTLQAAHKFHGTNVIGPMPLSDEFITVYPTAGDVMSLRVSRLALSPGWRPVLDKPAELC